MSAPTVIDCGNGWKVTVRVVDEKPFITTEYSVGDICLADSVQVDVIDDEVVFFDWHPYRHEEEA